MREPKSDSSSRNEKYQGKMYLTDEHIIAGFWVVLGSLAICEGQETCCLPQSDRKKMVNTERPELYMQLSVHELEKIFNEMDVSLSPDTILRYVEIIEILQESQIVVSVAKYDRARRDLFSRWGKTTETGKASWPPISRTIATRLGDGQWNRALSRLANSAQSQGKVLGESTYNDHVMMEAIRLYLADCERESTNGTYQGYITWRKDKGKASMRFPSASTLRQRFGSWDKAVQRTKEMATDSL